MPPLYAMYICTNSGKDLASFCQARAKAENDRVTTLGRICKNFVENVNKPAGRQGSYLKGAYNILEVHEEMEKNGARFSEKLARLHKELVDWADFAEGRRKEIKQRGNADEERLQNAESQMEKAKKKYDALAIDLDRARRAHGGSNRRFTLLGPKSTEQFERELWEKVNTADTEYATRVLNAQQVQRELILTQRPNTVNDLKSVMTDTDNELVRVMQELGTERLLPRHVSSID